MNALRIAKFSRTVSVEFAGETYRLDHEDALALREALAEAITGSEAFVHTVGEHRADGSYRVARRRADSAGNATVLDSFGRLETIFETLPPRFAPEDVERAVHAVGERVSGSRRNLLVRHFAEHPAFPCAIQSEQPLVARKQDDPGDR